MRFAVFWALIALCIMSRPAWADTGASPISTLPATDRYIGSTTIQVATGLPRGFRVRIDLATIDSATAQDDYRDRLRRRITSSMIDFYPLADQGFHVSVGTRFYATQNFARDAEKATNGLLYVPRTRTGGGSGIRTGFKRFTPAMTLGYTRTLGHNVFFGIEGGALMGRVYPRTPRSFAETRADHTRDGMGLNPVVSLAFGLRF